MTKEPKVDEVEYLIGIRVVGYMSLKDLYSAGSSDVFMKKPRVGTYYKFKNISHGES